MLALDVKKSIGEIVIFDKNFQFLSKITISPKKTFRVRGGMPEKNIVFSTFKWYKI